MSSVSAMRQDSTAPERAMVDDLVRKGRVAMRSLANASQARVDEAVTALAWSIYKPEHAKALAELRGEGHRARQRRRQDHQEAAQDLRHLARPDAAPRSVGVIEEDARRGIVKYAKPVGVVAAICPSTNPGATPVNKAMMALKGAQRRHHRLVAGRAPSRPARAVELIHEALKRIGAPEDLVQVLPQPVEQGIDAGADGSGRPRRLHRLAGQRAARLSQWHAGDRRRRRQCAGDRRRDRGSRRRGEEDLRVQDLRQRDALLVGELGDDRRCGVRPTRSPRCKRRGRLPGDAGRAREASRRRCGQTASSTAR